jgi:hypothetical protein
MERDRFAGHIRVGAKVHAVTWVGSSTGKMKSSSNQALERTAARRVFMFSDD